MLAEADLYPEMELRQFVDKVDLLKLTLAKTPEAVRFSFAICLLQVAVVQDEKLNPTMRRLENTHVLQNGIDAVEKLMELEELARAGGFQNC